VTRTLIGCALAAVFIAVLVMSLRSQTSVGCEVCIAFGGREVCRTNLAADRKQAIYGATSSACAVLASGVTLGIQCQNTPPRSLRCDP
jgi:hypothetical protein